MKVCICDPFFKDFCFLFEEMGLGTRAKGRLGKSDRMEFVNSNYTYAISAALSFSKKNKINVCHM